ncbi:MAG: type II toxin-antitoxin system PemK/MazF family toxin [Candidatus Vogelbacteria bacterium]|nr:type II toxin-antitoxin system PemK/MazF family toxin [Candidatus Vogelbacteria bacterium]
MVDKNYIPERGEIIWLNFSPSRGHEQRGRRPALVISPTTYNGRSGLVLVCPITSKSHHYPFEVEFHSEKVDGVILVDQLKSIDWRIRRTEFIDILPSEKFSVVQQLLARLVG